MAEHRRQRGVVIAVAPVLVGLAHPARDNPDQKLVRPRVAQIEPLDAERAKSLARNGSGDLHVKELLCEWIFQLSVLVLGRMDDHLLVPGQILIESAALYVLELHHDG